MLTAQQKFTNQPVVVLAGGAGFIGSFLAELLLLKGCRVVCFDNLSTGQKQNLKKCLTHQNFSFINHDIRQELPKKISRADYVFHLAGMEKGDLATVSQGTKNLLDFALTRKSKFLLASSHRVFQVKISSRRLSNYFGRQKKLADLASLAEGQRFAEALTTDYFQKQNLDARVVRLGDVYGPRMNLAGVDPLVSLINQALKKRLIKVPGDGSLLVYPTFVADVIYGLSKAMFGANTKGKIFSLVNPQGMTLLRWAKTLKTMINSQAKIEFVAAKNTPASLVLGEVSLGQKDLDWQPKVGVEEGLKQMRQFFGRTKSLPKKTAVPKRRLNKARVWTAILFLIVMVFLAPLLGFLAGGFLAVRNFQAAREAFTEGEFAQASVLARRTETHLGYTAFLANQLAYVLQPLNQTKAFVQAGRFLDTASELSAALGYLGEAANEGARLLSLVLQEETKNNETLEINSLVEKAVTNLERSHTALAKVEAVLAAESGYQQLATRIKMEPAFEKWRQTLPHVRRVILAAERILPDLPAAVGLPQRKTYLVLFQNNMELRPTGGFIGSYGLLTFDQGHLVDFEVRDVYSADGQLKGHVEPPEVLKKYLGEAGWYLRDANWNPDFPTSARQAAWFFEKETGRQVDGVLGLNLSVAKRLLGALEEIELVDFNEKITADNLFDRAEFYAETSFFPGSTQKEDFLGALARALYLRVKDAEPAAWLGLGEAFYQSLLAKDLTFYFNQPNLARTMIDLGWAGQVRRLDCQPDLHNQMVDCLNDYLFLVEANLGVNKANYFVTRSIKYQVEVDQIGQAENTLRLTWQNRSPSEVFPGGRYKNYLRLLTPRDAELVEVTVNGSVLEKKAIDQETLKNRTAFGFLVEVPVQSKTSVEIRYRLAEKITWDQLNHYQLLVQKQPGIKDEDFQFWLILPSKVAVLAAQPTVVATEQGYLWAPALDQDLVFKVSLVQ